MTILTALPSLIATAAGAAPTGPFGMPDQASTVAPTTDSVYSFITWICIFFFVLIVALMVIFVIKYAKPPGTPAEGGPSHHTPLEVTWTVIPLILVIFIFYKGMQGYIDIRSAPLGAYQVNVTAQKWNWTFNYNNGATTSELHVPAGQPVKLVMSSQDVLHSLYIPSFRVKQDVVPGRITTLWFEVNDTGEMQEFDLYCAEYCGTQHSTMLTKVYAYPPEQFATVIEDEANYIDKLPAEKLYTAGSRLYARCKSCHSLDGSNMTGPTWQGLWEKTVDGETVFTDGTQLADIMGPDKMYSDPADYITRSITHPQEKIVMNYTGAMPSFQGQLNQNEIFAIIGFLQNLDKFDADGNALSSEDDLNTILEQVETQSESSGDASE